MKLRAWTKTVAGWRRVVLIAAIGAVAARGATDSASVDAPEAPAHRDARMAWWREARFGLFIHWGLYSVAGGEWEGKRANTIASWMMSDLRVPPDEYAAALLPGFTADKFDPTAWAKLAKRAGMKYAVLTAKHHEGFCLFDSKLTDYDVMATPARRDVVKAYLDAFHAEGLKAGLYYSVIDWHHPQYPVAGDPFHPMRDNPAYKQQKRDTAKYVDYLHGQVRELLTGFGPVDILWWDFSYGRMAGKTWRSDQLMAMARSIQPAIIMNNRLYLDAYENREGDFTTPEQHVPPSGLGRDWETCMTINTTWGYKPYDLAYKSGKQLIRTLIDIASKGGNYLLNVGPRPDGTIPELQVERLEAIGRWMAVHGESIYGTQASPFPKAFTWGRCTLKPLANGNTRLYLHVFERPTNGRILLPHLGNRVTGAHLLSDTGTPPLEHGRDGNGVFVVLDNTCADTNAEVVVLDCEGAPEILPNVATAGADGGITLRAADADLHGKTIQYPSGGGTQDSIGYWTSTNDWASWRLRAPKVGRYRVSATCGVDEGNGGTVTIGVAGQTLTLKTSPTGSWFQRKTFAVGDVTLPAGVNLTLQVHTRDTTGLAALDLVRIDLTPVPASSPALLTDETGRPRIIKLGTIDIDMVETQPIVFGGTLYRFESVRKNSAHNTLGKPYFRFVEVATDKPTPAFAEGHDLGCAWVEDNTIYVFGTPGWGASTIDVFWSRDLVHWEWQVALKTDNWELFNTSVCKAGKRYVMAFEVGGPPEVAGQRFTNRFAESSDLKTWTILPEPAVYSKEKYSACPTLRHVDGFFYMVYLEATGNYQFNPFLVRSRDLVTWQASPMNPLIHFDDADKLIGRTGFSEEQRATIAAALNRNNSDWDYCEYDGQVIINYSWGDQAGHEFLAAAFYPGPLKALLSGCFPRRGPPGGDPRVELIETGGSAMSGNLAAAAAGAVAFSLNDYGEFHTLDKLTDGRYGNASTWIGATDGSFVGVRFPRTTAVGALAFGRDNTGAYSDRCLGIYGIQYTRAEGADADTPDDQWTDLFALDYAASPPPSPAGRHLFRFPPVEATAIRVVTVRNKQAGPHALGIDELEIYGPGNALDAGSVDPWVPPRVQMPRPCRPRPSPIVKRGYLNSPLVETTPIAFKGELYLLECWRSNWQWEGAPSPSVKQRAEMWIARLPDGFEHYDDRKYVSRALEDCTLGTALVWDERVYVYGTTAGHSGGGQSVMMTSSENLRDWTPPVKVLTSPSGRIFNTAVTRTPKGMVFLWETDSGAYGQHAFTMCYGKVAGPNSQWNPGIIDGAVYGSNKYTGGPALYYENEWYYTLYLESLGGGRYETRITRSQDLKQWQDAPPDRPFLTFDSTRTGLPVRPPNVKESNASDAELCFHKGRTLITFTGADQVRGGDLQWATFDGTPQELFETFFDDNTGEK